MPNSVCCNVLCHDRRLGAFGKPPGRPSIMSALRATSKALNRVHLDQSVSTTRALVLQPFLYRRCQTFLLETVQCVTVHLSARLKERLRDKSLIIGYHTLNARGTGFDEVRMRFFKGFVFALLSRQHGLGFTKTIQR
jgi:hypothetical protein